MSDKNTYLGKNEPLLVIIGPSGTGKSKIVTELVKNEVVELTPSWTTRPLRKDEERPIDHIFVSEKEFLSKKEERIFLETVQLFGSYWYGLPRVTYNSPERIPTIMLRSMVLEPVYKYYKNVHIYQIESSFETILKRLGKRGDSPDVQQSRKLSFQQEILDGRKIADRIYNNNSSFSYLMKTIRDDLERDFRN